MIGPVSALQSGLSAVRRGVERLDAAAAVVSTAYLPTDAGTAPGSGDVLGALVEMMLARHQVGLGSKVIERASQTDRAIFDVLA
jgi:hypothetical protein